MNWFRRLLLSLSLLKTTTTHPNNNIGPGLLKLHNDIQTCGYEDVQVMWEMLSRTESEMTSHRPKQKQSQIQRVFESQNQTNTSP